MRIKVIATIINGEDEAIPSQYVFDSDEIIIGRSPHSDLCLNDPTLSSMHAKLFISPDPNHHGRSTLFLKDLGSSNGTSLENFQLRPFCEVPLDSKRWIRLGMCLIKASLDDGKASKEIVGEIVSRIEENGAALQDTGFEFNEQPALEVVSAKEESMTSDDNNVLQSAIGQEVFAALNGQQTPVTPLKGEEEAVAPLHEQPPSLTAATGTVTSADITDLDFEAYKLINITGTIFHNGQPLAGVSVNAGDLGVVISDESGCFAFQNLHEGSPYEITLELPGYEFSPDVFTGTAESDCEFVASATRLFSISGRVVHRGVPLNDVEIDAGPLGRVVTDEDGFYTLQKVRPNTNYEIRARKAGFEFNRRTLHIDISEASKPLTKLKLVTNG